MIRILKIFISLYLTSISLGHAFVEFHTHYGSSKGSPDAFNNAYYKNQSGPELTKQSFLGFDAIARYGAFPLRMGIRYEAISEESSGYGEKAIMTGSRFSGVLNFRFINEKQYLGIIGTHGFSHHLNLELKNSDEMYSTSSGKSSSIGLEGGVKFGPLRLGAEIGQLFLVFSELKDKSGNTPIVNGENINKIDLTAFYYKLIVGVGF